MEECLSMQLWGFDPTKQKGGIQQAFAGPPSSTPASQGRGVKSERSRPAEGPCPGRYLGRDDKRRLSEKCPGKLTGFESRGIARPTPEGKLFNPSETT